MMASNKPKYPSYDFLLTGARFVLGSLTEKQTKDQQGRDRQSPILFAAFAVDKRTPGVDAHIGNIIGYARHTYGFVPNGQHVGPRLQHPNFMAKSGFAWKLKDGDTDPAWSQREGCRGCWIFLCQTSLDTIRCCDSNNAQLDPRAIELGDWVEVFIGVTVNGEVGDTAGLYLNPNGVRLTHKGQRIIPAGQSFDQMFAQPAQMPIGYQPPAAAPVPSSWQQPAAPQGGYAPPAAPQGYPPQQAAPAPQQWQQAAPAPQGYPPQQQAAPGYAPPPAPTPAPQAGYAPPVAHPGATPGMPTYPQHTGGYPQAGGQPGTPMPPAGGAPSAYPSSPAPNGYPVAPGQPASYPQPAPAYAPAAPAGAPQGGYAPSAAQPSYPATAYPSNPNFVAGPR
jgi:hypothetical protein